MEKFEDEVVVTLEEVELVEAYRREQGLDFDGLAQKLVNLGVGCASRKLFRASTAVEERLAEVFVRFDGGTCG